MDGLLACLLARWLAGRLSRGVERAEDGLECAGRHVCLLDPGLQGEGQVRPDCGGRLLLLNRKKVLTIYPWSAAAAVQ